jgi:hypothetical protein
MNLAGINTSEEKRFIVMGIVSAVMFHIMFGLGIYFAEKNAAAENIMLPGWERLCSSGRRCLVKTLSAPMRKPDEMPLAEIGIIEATIIPRLGYAEKLKGMPKLTKYEQPEKTDEGINIFRDNDITELLKNKAKKAKQAEMDKRRKTKTLSEIISGAPEDDDPRKRPSALDKIIGSAEGDFMGTGTENMEGNLYGGRVALALRNEFKIPTFIAEKELKELVVSVRISKMSENGDITEYEIIMQSGNPHYNSAVLSTIKKFSKKDGGKLTLPAPDSRMLQYINTKGMEIHFDGQYFKPK